MLGFDLRESGGLRLPLALFGDQGILFTEDFVGNVCDKVFDVPNLLPFRCFRTRIHPDPGGFPDRGEHGFNRTEIGWVDWK